MPREGAGPDFIEALARGLEVIAAFGPHRPEMTLAEVAASTGLARPTARRILLTLTELGYVRSGERGFALTPRVLELGVAYVGSMGLWDVARPHLEALSARTHESCSIAQLDGSDIVYVARASVPKIVSLAVQIGTRFPALPTSLGKVQLAALPPDELDRVLAEPTRSGLVPRWRPTREERDAALREVRARGWALTDEQLTLGIRSVAAPLRDGTRAGHRRGQRQLPRRRDLGRAPGRAPPAPAARDGGGDQRRLRPPGGAAARHAARVLKTRSEKPGDRRAPLPRHCTSDAASLLGRRGRQGHSVQARAEPDGPGPSPRVDPPRVPTHRDSPRARPRPRRTMTTGRAREDEGVVRWRTNREVVIVGAGPAGLVLAWLLHRADVPFVLVERLAQAEIGTQPKAGHRRVPHGGTAAP